MRMIMTGAQTHYEHHNNEHQYTVNLGTPGYIQRQLYNIKDTNNEVSNYFYFKWRPGPPEYTGNPLDFAIDARGKGFFVVQLPQGLGYTRDGRCRIDYEGRLVLMGGNHPILGENGIIKLNNDNITVTSGGLIYDENGLLIDRLKVIVFKSTEQMKKLLGSPNGVIFFAEKPLDIVEGQEYYRIQHRWIETTNTRRTYDIKWSKQAYEATVNTGHLINKSYRTASSLSSP